MQSKRLGDIFEQNVSSALLTPRERKPQALHDRLAELEQSGLSFAEAND